MTWNKSTVKVKDPENNPVHILYLAAKQIVEINKRAHDKAGKNIDGTDVNLDIWMKEHPLMKVTISTGPAIEAEYAIFQAQTK